MSLAQNRRLGSVPARVESLDECFHPHAAVETGTEFLRHGQGFHYYGADLCLQAEFLGGRSYAIDFHLQPQRQGPCGRKLSTYPEPVPGRNIGDTFPAASFIASPGGSPLAAGGTMPPERR
jgi:hypothetical protein